MRGFDGFEFQEPTGHQQSENKNHQGIINSIPCFTKCHEKFWFKNLVFQILFAVCFFDFVTDWWLFRDVNNTENGLVFGPPIQAKKWALLAFDIFGTVMFIFEVVNLWRDIFRNNPCVDVDLISAITIWMEDVPQIVINVSIVFCREEAISVLQLLKASVILLVALVLLIKAVYKCCNNGSKCSGGITIIGLIINLGCAIVIFIFTQSERTPNGGITLKVPHNVFAEEYDEKKYFNDVSAYFSHPALDYAEVSDISEIPLLRLAQMSNLREKSHDYIIKIQYTKNPNRITYFEGNTMDTLTLIGCFEVDRINKKLKIGKICPTSATQTTIGVIIKFHYVKAYYPGLVFGNVLYNLRVYQNYKCEVPSFSVVHDLGERIENVNNVLLRYYRTEEMVSDASPVMHLTSSDAQFFYTEDLIDITNVWKTGFGFCECTGNLSPVLDESIQVDCT